MRKLAAAVFLAVEAEFAGEAGGAEEAVLLLEVDGLEGGMGGADREDHAGVLVGADGESGGEGAADLAGLLGGAGEVPGEALPAAIAAFGALRVVGDGGDMAQPVHMAVFVDQRFREAEMGGDAAQVVEALQELRLGVEVGVGEKEARSAALGE